MPYPTCNVTGRATDGSTTWPSQTPDQVARAIVRGIERDQRAIYPSRVFRVFLLLNGVLPVLGRIVQAIENRRLQRWLRRRSSDAG